MSLDKIVIAVCIVFDILLAWAAYSLGIDNLMFLLTVGGGIGLASAGCNRNDEWTLGFLALAILGCLFALVGVGFLAALALFAAFLLSTFVTAVLLQS